MENSRLREEELGDLVVLTPSTLADRYRRKAERLRALAEGIADAESRAAVLRVADGYDDMAGRAAARAAADVPPDDAR